MTEFFLDIVNMSISAGWLVLAVLVLRLILKNAPKWVNVMLWGIVAIRLICPLSIESPVSLIPNSVGNGEMLSGWMDDYVGDIDIHHSNSDHYDAAIQAGLEPVYDGEGGYYVVTKHNQYTQPETVENTVVPVLAVVWLAGIAIMALYTAISYLSLGRKLRTAVRLRENIFQCETVPSPCVLGLLKPKIYLPFDMDKQNREHVIAHERAHIRRRDHWWKPLGFLLLTIHWFNPLMWVAYILLCRDIELACDEKVIGSLDNEQRADYTQALVNCSVNRFHVAACPLAFGEVGVKARVKSIMNYRKPTFWIMTAAVTVCVIVAVCFLTDPMPSPEFAMSGNNVRSLDVDQIMDRIFAYEDISNSNVYMNADNFSLMVDSDFNWVDSQAIRYFFWEDHKTQSAQLRIFPDENKYFLTESGEWTEQNRIFLLRHYLEAIKYLPQEAIAQLAPADRYQILHIDGGQPGDFERVITYSSEGVGETDGWYLHLRVEPLHALSDGGFHGTGEEVVELFYGDKQSDSGYKTDTLIPGTTYVPYQCIYMNPLSSYAAIAGDSGCTYLIGEDSFTTLYRNDRNFVSVTHPDLDTAGANANNIIPVTKWEWQEFPYTDEEWGSFYWPGSFNSIEKISAYFDHIYYQPLIPGKFLLNLDGSIWLVELSSDQRVGTYIWCIYSLVPEASMGFAQWEFAPMLSSRLPVFRFEFDMEYTSIEASCDAGILVPWETPGKQSDSVMTYNEGSALYWSPSDEDGSTVTSAKILFTVMQGETPVYQGNIYLEGNSGSGGRRIYNASLIGAGLYLSPNLENEGALLSSTEVSNDEAFMRRYDLTKGKLEIPVEELCNYAFYTNSTEISIKIKSEEEFIGNITLVDVSQNNAEIMYKDVQGKRDSCVFHNLTSARLYRIVYSGLEGCTIVIGE